MTKYVIRFFGRKLSEREKQMAADFATVATGPYVTACYAKRNDSFIISEYDEHTEMPIETREFNNRGRLSRVTTFDPDGKVESVEEYQRPGSILGLRKAA